MSLNAFLGHHELHWSFQNDRYDIAKFMVDYLGLKWIRGLLVGPVKGNFR